jgi:hypothetical protein
MSRRFMGRVSLTREAGSEARVASSAPPPKGPPRAKGDKRGAPVDTRGSRSERDRHHSVGARGRVQRGAQVGIAFGGRHGFVHQAEDHRCDGGGADGGDLGPAGPRLKLPIVNFRRPIGRRHPETLRRGVRRLLWPPWSSGESPSLAESTGRAVAAACTTRETSRRRDVRDHESLLSLPYLTLHRSWMV